VRIAAVIILIAIPAFLLYFYISKPMPQKFVATTGVSGLQLPDGSEVTLNSGTILYYPSRFTKHIRNVNLFGEAWFEIAHDQKHPFVISCGKIRVEAVGTSFYVNTSNKAGNTEVILVTGKVAVYNEDQPFTRVILAPGEKALIREEDQQISKSVNNDPNFLSWKTRKFTFTNDPMKVIIPALNKL